MEVIRRINDKIQLLFVGPARDENARKCLTFCSLEFEATECHLVKPTNECQTLIGSFSAKMVQFTTQEVKSKIERVCHINVHEDAVNVHLQTGELFGSLRRVFNETQSPIQQGVSVNWSIKSLTYGNETDLLINLCKTTIKTLRGQLFEVQTMYSSYSNMPHSLMQAANSTYLAVADCMKYPEEDFFTCQRYNTSCQIESLENCLDLGGASISTILVQIAVVSTLIGAVFAVPLVFILRRQKTKRDESHRRSTRMADGPDHISRNSENEPAVTINNLPGPSIESHESAQSSCDSGYQSSGAAHSFIESDRQHLLGSTSSHDDAEAYEMQHISSSNPSSAKNKELGQWSNDSGYQSDGPQKSSTEPNRKPIHEPSCEVIDEHQQRPVTSFPKPYVIVPWSASRTPTPPIRHIESHESIPNF